MRVQSHFSKVVLLGLVFLAAPLAAQLAPAVPPDTRQMAEVAQGEAPAGQCKAQPAQKEDLPLFIPKPVPKQEITCYYSCETCSGQMVNRACCISPIGSVWCVSSCTSGCDPNGGGGPDRPTQPIEP